MVKVQIFKHMSHGALTDKINHFIADQNLEPENIHDIKLAAGPENSMLAMIIYIEPEEDSFNFNNEEE